MDSVNPNPPQPKETSTYIVQIVFYILSMGFLALMAFGILELAVPIAIAFLLSFLLYPLADMIEGWGVPRAFAVLIVIGALVGVIYFAVTMIIPMLENEFKDVIAEAPRFEEVFIKNVDKAQIYAKKKLPGFMVSQDWNVAYFMGKVFAYLKSFTDMVIDKAPAIGMWVILTPIITFIFLLEGDEIYKRLITLVPNRYFEMALLLIYRIKRQISSYLKGLVIQWIILMIIFNAGFYIIGIPYAPLLSIVASSVNIVPYLGPIVGITPAVIVAALDSNPSMLISVLIIFALVHIVDNVFTQPVVLAKSVELHPLLAILALITMERLFGVVGMVIAIPMTGVMLVTIEVMYKSLKAFRVI